MTTPDLTALRILVERVEQLDRAIYALKREGDLHADEIAVHAALPAAREALERVESGSEGEEWQAREKVGSLMTLVALRADEWPKCMWFAGWLSRQESLEIGEALARLAAVRGTT